jgi:hypothetical protein
MGFLSSLANRAKHLPILFLLDVGMGFSRLLSNSLWPTSTVYSLLSDNENLCNHTFQNIELVALFGC